MPLLASGIFNMKILIQDPYEFYRDGLKHFFIEIFFGRTANNIIFLTSYSQQNFDKADIVVISLAPGEHLMCFPELQNRTTGIIIGLTDEVIDSPSDLPFCIARIIFIHRQDSLSTVKEKVLTAWRESRKKQIQPGKTLCFHCPHKVLTRQQRRIMSFICQGITTSEIARNMSISEKTLYVHKYIIRKKFNLRTNHALFCFLQKLAGKNSQQIYLRQIPLNA